MPKIIDSLKSIAKNLSEISWHITSAVLCLVGGTMGILIFLIAFFGGVNSLLSGNLYEAVVYSILFVLIFTTYVMNLRLRKFLKLVVVRQDIPTTVFAVVIMEGFWLSMCTSLILSLLTFILNVTNFQNLPEPLLGISSTVNQFSQIIPQFFLMLVSPVIFLPFMFLPAILGISIYMLTKHFSRTKTDGLLEKIFLYLVGFIQIVILLLFSLEKLDWLFDLIMQPFMESSFTNLLAKYAVGLPAAGFWRIISHPPVLTESEELPLGMSKNIPEDGES